MRRRRAPDPDPDAARPAGSDAGEPEDVDEEPPAGPLGRSWRKILAVAGAVSLFLGLATTVGPWAFGWWQGRQPAHDQRLLHDVEVGILFSELTKRLGEDPVEAYSHFEADLGHGPTQVTDYLYLLEIAYVEAFVDDDASVVAYAITMRNGATSGPLRNVGGAMRLGETTLADAMGRLSTAYLAGGCGVHIEHFYEVSDNSNANDARRVAFGLTNAGIRDAGVPHADCPAGLLAEAVEPVASPSVTFAMYAPELLRAPVGYESQPGRDAVIVNSVVVTDSGVELVPEMLALHPDNVTNVDPWTGFDESTG